MKRICTLLISLFITGISFGQSITEVAIPQYIILGGTNKVPFAYRITFNDLKPNATYKYYNRFVNEPDTVTITGSGTATAGFGLYMLVNKTTNVFSRVTLAPNFSDASRHGTFTTDASGSYTGWFMNEPTGTTGGNFAGNKIYIRVFLNDGLGGTAIDLRLSAKNSPINVISFGTASTNATAVCSSPATFASPKNFVMLYDNAAGTGRPIAGTVIEGDGVANTATNAYSQFYAGGINEVARTWGTVIPNDLPNGIKRIVQYGLANGETVGSSTSVSGTWAKAGGNTVNTVNPAGTDTLNLDGTAVPLTPPVDQTITFPAPGTIKYGDLIIPQATATSTLPVSYKSSLPAIADTVRVNGQLNIIGKSVGTTDITAIQTGNNDYKPAPEVTTQLIVEKAPLTIKANKLFWLQGTPMPELTASYSGFVNGDDSADLTALPVLNTAANTGSPVGPYLISISGATSPNYEINFVTDTIFIVGSKQPQTISFGPLASRIYGEPDFDPGASVPSRLPISYTSSDTNVATITASNKIHIKKAGATTITASQGGNDTYDPAPDVSLLLTINKRPLTITAVDTSRFYGQNNPTFRLIYSGFVNGETNTKLLTQPIVTTTATVNSDAGKYPITVKDATSDNYDLIYNNGELTVLPLLAQTINFPEISTKKYGDADFIPGARASSGLAVAYTSSNTNVAAIENGTTVRIVGAGTAVITASQSGDATYGPAPDVTKTLTVQKASLTIRANNETKNEGQPNPAFTIIYSGFVNGDDSTKLTILPEANTIATTASVAGTYRINVQGAASSSYTINHQNGILTILPAQGEGQDNINAYVSGPDQLTINVFAVNTVKVAVQLFDLNGSRMSNTTVTLNKGFNSYRIPIGHLSPGIYNVRVAGGEVMLKTKIVVQ